MRVRKAVIPAGGLGTRLLPLSKSVPKELLPVFHKPLVQLAAEELAGAGIEETTLVVSPGKPAFGSLFSNPTHSSNRLSPNPGARSPKL